MGAMKILHLGKFFPPDRGGIETHLALLAAGSSAWGDVEVAVAQGSQPAGLTSIGGAMVRRMRTLGVLAATPICPGLLRVIRDARADVIHIHHPNPLAMAAYLASGTRAACVVTYHADIVRQRLLRRLTAPIVNATLRRSAAIVVASPRLAERSPVLQPFRDKCHLVPFGIDARAAAQADPDAVASLRREYGPRIVLAVGRLTAYKGFDQLIRAMSHVDASLVIVGDGQLREPLAELIARERLASRVHLAGTVTDVAPYYAACDVFVLPSVTRNEAFGIVQLEAMAMGKPVINTALDSGVTFVCPPGVAGLTVPPRDRDALAAAINRLLDDAALRHRLGDGGRRRVHEQFTVDRMVQRTLHVYREALASRS